MSARVLTDMLRHGAPPAVLVALLVGCGAARPVGPSTGPAAEAGAAGLRPLAMDPAPARVEPDGPPTGEGGPVGELAEDQGAAPADGGPAPAPIAGDAGEVVTAAPPAAARLTRLTAPGCCVGPSWAADGRSVWFIDRPAPDAPAGLWSASVDTPDAAPRLVEAEVASYAPGLEFRVDVGEDDTTVTRRSDGTSWTLPTGGRPVILSPDRQRAAWTASQAGVPNERQTARVWVAELGGGAPRELAALPRGALSGWLDDATLLVRGRESAQANEEVLWALSLADGQRREIARAERLRGELAAPGGRWLAYYVSQSADPAANGMWLASTDGAAPRKLDPALFGAYRWRDGERLLVVPLQADGASHRLLELDAATLGLRPLTDPAATSFKIANGDWAVSPDGRRVAFVESADRALWVIELP